MSGLEQMKRFQRRELPYGPLWYLTGMEMQDFAACTATFRLPCTGWLRSPSGVIPGGVLASVADGALAAALQTTLDPGRVLTTSHLSLTFIRPPDPHSDAVLARARQVHRGRAQGVSEAHVVDSGGHLLAHASARCIITEVPRTLPDPPPGPVTWPDYAGPHPFQRPVEGTVLPQEVWDTSDGMAMLRGWEAGTLARSPLSNLIAAGIRDVKEGSVTCTIPATPWLCGMTGHLYGGALALLADYAVHGAVQSLLPPRTAWATLDLSVRFLRPASPDHRLLLARPRVLHRGRRTCVVTVEISTGEEKVVALADACVMLLSHRSWSRVATLTDEPDDVPVDANGEDGTLDALPSAASRLADW